MKKIVLSVFLICSFQVHAGLPEMMKIYNNPQSAPKVPKCKGDINCNAFVALSKQWKSIPTSYRYDGFDIRKDAKEGDGYGLNKGFSLAKDRSVTYSEVGGDMFYYYNKGFANERIFAQGLAVLLYIEDKNKWAKY